MLDHINAEYPESYEFDNRKCNLRKCNKRQNAKNLTRGRSDNKSGHQCIYRNTHDTSWTVNVKFKGEKCYVPSFPDSVFDNPLQEALLCRDALKNWLIKEDLTNIPCLANIQNKHTRSKVLLYVDRIQEREYIT
jgi:hypothetical protein